MGCQNSDYSTNKCSASLHVTINNAEIGVTTRGMEDLNDDGIVSEEEIYIDGQKIYRLAVFLLNGDNIVSSTILENNDTRFTNNNSEATISFINLDYSKTYKLYAVANYGNYDNLEGKLADVNDENVNSGLRVSASTDNICNRETPYPLTFSKEIQLTPGANYIHGELLRTYARLRINVRNQSSLNNLYVTSLSFAQNFTQQNVDIFTEGGTANVSPVTTSNDAITPFVENHIISKLDENGNVSESTIFDSYILESQGGNYNYRLGIKYEGAEEDTYIVNSSAITNSSNIEDGCMYIIYNANARKYLYAGNGYVASGDSYLSNGDLNHDYVWKFNRTAANQYTIESMGATGYFMQSSQTSSSRVPLTVSPGYYDYYTASTSSNNIRFKSNYGSNYYLAVNGSTVYGNNSTSSSRQRRNNFYLYKVEKHTISSDITHSETIPINIIDKNSGEAQPITAIHRNDFIDILINVSYNEKSGDIEFEVSNWEKIEGDITFD